MTTPEKNEAESLERFEKSKLAFAAAQEEMHEAKRAYNEARGLFIFLLENSSHDYDMYDSFVVCAYTKESAKSLVELKHESYLWEREKISSSIDVTLVGKAADSLRCEKIILGSFNAG